MYIVGFEQGCCDTFCLSHCCPLKVSIAETVLWFWKMLRHGICRRMTRLANCCLGFRMAFRKEQKAENRSKLPSRSNSQKQSKQTAFKRKATSSLQIFIGKPLHQVKSLTQSPVAIYCEFSPEAPLLGWLGARLRGKEGGLGGGGNDTVLE